VRENVLVLKSVQRFIFQANSDDTRNGSSFIHRHILIKETGASVVLVSVQEYRITI
jgi:hypothetical protein